MKGYEEALKHRLNQPFQRRPIHGETEADMLERAIQLRKEVTDTLRTLGEDKDEGIVPPKAPTPQRQSSAPQGFTMHQNAARLETKRQSSVEGLGAGGAMNDLEIQEATDIFAARWNLKDDMSEVAFKGMLLILEYCLSKKYSYFSSQ